jgi:Tat protein secretion system quality control protein TatD with DNase activity
MRRLVDFHCHLDLYPDHAGVIAECERREVFTLAVTTTPRAWPRNHELASPTKYVRAALGLHPQLVQDHAKDIELWREYLSRARYVGEVGLEKIQAASDQLVERLNAFMMLTMWRIQDIRLRYQTKNYLCHLFPIARWCA